VTILQRAGRLLKEEEPEISERLRERLAGRMEIHLNTEAVEASKGEDGRCRVIGVDKATGKRNTYLADKVLVAAGRRSNADLLQPEKTGVQLDDRG